ncbi:MAG: hypothetical protein GY934_11125, partial [Gammaproteobacteria bacterium]|nr:hypothetical protein [Gammaproteobacteria bacterium]
NGNNQIQALHIPSEGQMAWTDFRWMNPQVLVLPGGNKINLGYDDLLQPKQYVLKDNADATIASADYTYGLEGNIKQIVSEHGSYNFDYDELYRLEKATYPWGQTSGATAAPGGLAGFETFDHDGVGNRTEQGEADKADQPPAVATSGYNNHNQLSSTDNGLTYSYNDNGHTSQRLRSSQSPLTHLPAITDYIYNHDERLIAIRHDGVTVAEFAYNPNGQRIKKSASGQTTWYLYNSEGLAAEYDASGNLIVEYHFKPYATWMTTPLFQRTAAGQVYYYQNDHLGTPQRMLAKSGAVVWEARYGAFGEASIITETVANNLRFPGQYYDDETGLYYNYFRTYDPSTGRYITSDPIGLEGGLNTYRYVGGNPVNFIDPRGLLLDTSAYAAAAGTATGTSVAVASAAVAGAAAVGIVIGIGINYLVETTTGESVGSHIYNVLNPNDPRDKFWIDIGLDPDDYSTEPKPELLPDTNASGNSAKAKKCREYCSKFELEKGYGQWAYRNCLIDCMKNPDKYGCE